MTHLVVLRGGVRLEVTDDVGKLLIAQVAATLSRGCPVWVGDEMLLRVEEVQLIGPLSGFPSADKQQIRAKVNVTRPVRSGK